MRKGDAALGIDQQPIERRADASGYRRRSLGVGVDDVGERIVSAAFELGPVEIAFDARAPARRFANWRRSDHRL